MSAIVASEREPVHVYYIDMNGPVFLHKKLKLIASPLESVFILESSSVALCFHLFSMLQPLC